VDEKSIGLSRFQLIALLTSMIAVGGVATNIYVPTLPAIAADFQTSPASVQLTLTTYFAGVALAQLVWGPLADRYGRRPVLFAGLGIFLIGSGACAIAPTIDYLIIARFFQAVGACVGQVIGRAVVRDLFDRDETARAMASITFAIAIAPAAAPVLGAYVYLWAGWRTTFAVVALFALIVAVVAYRVLPETLPKPSASSAPVRVPGRLSGMRTMAANYASLMRSPAFLGYTLTSMCIFAALFAFVSVAPFIVINMLGETPLAYSLYSMITVLGFAVGSFSAGRLTPKIGIDRAIVMGLGILVVSALVMFGWAQWGTLSLASIIGPMIFVVLGMGIVFPNSTAGALSIHPEIAGTASAMLGFLQMSGAGLSIVVIGIIDDGTHRPMTQAMLVYSVLAGAAYLMAWLKRPGR